MSTRAARANAPTDPARLVVLGAGGRMGQVILDKARREPGILLHGAVELPTHPLVGHPASPDLPDLKIVGTLDEALEGADVIIDFTRPEGTIAALEQAAKRKIGAVIGTTGMNAAQKDALAEFATEIPIVFSPNMSVGINVMLWLLRIAADALGEGYDVELFEMHHRNKADAPSGTALRIAEVLCESRGLDPEQALNYGRRGLEPRTSKEIGVQALRGGDVAGEHTVFFLGEGERLEITHRASSRLVFAQGALRAARWVHGRPPGLYGMDEVLGL